MIGIKIGYDMELDKIKIGYDMELDKDMK